VWWFADQVGWSVPVALCGLVPAGGVDEKASVPAVERVRLAFRTWAVYDAALVGLCCVLGVHEALDDGPPGERAATRGAGAAASFVSIG
jgi:hypothetical protein